MVDTANALSREVELIRALAEDLAIEILASYTDEDFAEADLARLGRHLDHVDLRLVLTSRHFGEKDHAIPLSDVEKVRSAHPSGVDIHVPVGSRVQSR
jgi:hypothetical protein